MRAIHLTVALLGIAFLTLFSSFSAQAQNPKDVKKNKIDAGLLLIPADGVIDLEKGTCEVRFSLDYSFSDYMRPAVSGCVPFEFLKLYSYDENNSTLLTVNSYNNKDTIFNIQVRQIRGLHQILFFSNYYFALTGTPPEPHIGLSISGDKERGAFISKGEWHTLAVTWQFQDGKWKREMFLDGKKWRHMFYPEKEIGIRPIGKNDLIGIGSLDFSSGSIQAMRISNRVRSDVELSLQDPLKRDDATTFFIDGSIAAKCKELDKEDLGKLGKALKRKGKDEVGVFVGNHVIVDSPEGKAIQFYKKLSR